MPGDLRGGEDGVLECSAVRQQTTLFGGIELAVPDQLGDLGAEVLDVPVQALVAVQQAGHHGEQVGVQRRGDLPTGVLGHPSRFDEFLGGPTLLLVDQSSAC